MLHTFKCAIEVKLYQVFKFLLIFYLSVICGISLMTTPGIVQDRGVLRLLSWALVLLLELEEVGALRLVENWLKASLRRGKVSSEVRV